MIELPIRIRITADRKAFRSVVYYRFAAFQKLTEQSSQVVARDLENGIEDLIASRLARQPNPQRHARNLAKAFHQSIAPIKTGRGGFGVGIRIADEGILTRHAAYWHAIEVGSDHIVGMRVLGFGRRVGSRFSGGLDAPGVKSGQPDALVTRRSGAVIRRPIRAHNYMTTISARAVSRFGAAVERDLTKAFS